MASEHDAEEAIDLWRQGKALADEAEQLKFRALRIALEANGWRLKAVARLLNEKSTSLRRVVQRDPPLFAEYRRRRPAH